MNDAILQIANKQLQSARRILVVSHIRPDGDAVGSLLGLGLSLQAAGKDVQMVLADGVPKNFNHLAGIEQVRHKPEGSFDLIAVVDCSDMKRVGDALNGYSIPDLNIDHHPTNLEFARLNIVNQDAAATAEMLAEFLPKLSLPMTQPVAAALLNGLITDTLGFRTVNMSPKVLRIAADLMEVGVDLPTIYQKALLDRSYEALRYWGVGLAKLKREGLLVWTSLSLEDRRSVEYPGRDDADLINILSTIEEAGVVVIFIQQTGGKVKVSWRSQPGYDVSQIALMFGGGGHKVAAGAEVSGDLEEVQEKVLKITRKLFAESVNQHGEKSNG